VIQEPDGLTIGNESGSVAEAVAGYLQSIEEFVRVFLLTVGSDSVLWSRNAQAHGYR